MKGEQQKGMPQRAIEQFADVTTGFASEALTVDLHSRSDMATGIMANAKNYQTNHKRFNHSPLCRFTNLKVNVFHYQSCQFLCYPSCKDANAYATYGQKETQDWFV